MHRLGWSFVVVACTIGCRRKAPEATKAAITKEAPVEASVDAPIDATDAATETSVVGSATTPAPPPPMPKVACTVDPRVRWALELPDVDSFQAGSASGPEGFSCSPFHTGSAPFELTMMAPGTMLRIPLDVQVRGDAGEWDSEWDATRVSAGLPKGAWIDPADRTLKWKVQGADGDVLSLAVGGIAPSVGPKACVMAEIVVRVRDDILTRRAQAAMLAADESGPFAITGLAVPGGPPSAEVRAILDKLRCGQAPVDPQFYDADGDGLEDALFPYYGGGGGRPSETAVWLRRKDTFTRVGRVVGSPMRASDGATFIVDTASAGTGYSCAIGIKIHQVMTNRLQLRVDESTQALLSPSDTSCGGPGDGIRVDVDMGKLVGFTDQATKGGVAKRRVFRWNGKLFALAP